LHEQKKQHSKFGEVGCFYQTAVLSYSLKRNSS
jgi:hypothetical protein